MLIGVCYINKVIYRSIFVFCVKPSSLQGILLDMSWGIIPGRRWGMLEAGLMDLKITILTVVSFQLP